jgi:hypothetical protein
MTLAVNDDVHSLPILTVKTCKWHADEGPRVIKYCGRKVPSFVAMPVKSKAGYLCGFCELERSTFTILHSSQREVEGNLRSPGPLKFEGSLHVKGDVQVSELRVVGNLTVDGSLELDYYPDLTPLDVWGRTEVKGEIRYGKI